MIKCEVNPKEVQHLRRTCQEEEAIHHLLLVLEAMAQVAMVLAFRMLNISLVSSSNRELIQRPVSKEAADVLLALRFQRRYKTREGEGRPSELPTGVQ